MPLANLDDVIAATKSAGRILKNTSVPTVAALNTSSYWAAAGTPAAGTLAIGNSAAGTVLDNTTTGAMGLPTIGAGQFGYIFGGSVLSTVTGTLYLYDRIWGCGNATPVNGAYTNPAQTLDVYRPSTGEGVELWAEVTTVFSATAHTLTATYVNQAGTTGRTATVTIPASAPVARMFQFTLQAGDFGVRRVTALSGSSAPTGAFNILAMRQVLATGPATGVALPISAANGGLTPIHPSSCLFPVFLASSTSAPSLDLSLQLAIG